MRLKALKGPTLSVAWGIEGAFEFFPTGRANEMNDENER